MHLVSVGWARKDSLGTIPCLGTARLGSAHTGTSCSKQQEPASATELAGIRMGGAVLAVVQPALLREPCTKESSEAVSGVSQPCWVMFEKISRCSMMGTSPALRRMGALREPSAPALSSHPTGMSSVPTLQFSSQ